jgi:hypothetical protein
MGTLSNRSYHFRDYLVQDSVLDRAIVSISAIRFALGGILQHFVDKYKTRFY